MHFWVALFHDQDSDPNELMNPFSYEDEEYQKFNEEFSKEDAEEMFEDFKKTKEGKDYKADTKTYMQDFHSCYAQDEVGDFGNTSNPNGIYDWFCVGGRVACTLFPKMSNKELKKIQNDELNKKEKFIRHLAEYMRLRSLSPKEYILERERTLDEKDHSFKYDLDKGHVGQTSVPVREFDEKTTLEMWGNKKIAEIFTNVICEDGGLFNVERFSQLLKYWRKKNGMLTIIDCHT